MARFVPRQHAWLHTPTHEMTRSRPQTRSQEQWRRRHQRRPFPEPEVVMGGVYVYGEDDFACYVGMAYMLATKGRNENGRRIPWQEVSEEERKKRVWKQRRSRRLSPSEKDLLQKYERRRILAENLPGTVAETPPHYWVKFACVESWEADAKIKQWEALERQEIQKRRNAVNRRRYNGRTASSLLRRRFNELQHWP